MAASPLRTALFDYAKVNVHWFPSHMNTGMREMRGMMRKVDVVLEMRDARILQLRLGCGHDMVSNCLPS